MIDIFQIWEDMEKEELEAKKKALEAKKIEEQYDANAEYSPEPKIIKKETPTQPEEVSKNVLQSDIPEHESDDGRIDGGDSV